MSLDPDQPPSMSDNYATHPVDPLKWVEDVSPIEIHDETEDEKYGCVSPLISPSQYEEDPDSDDESDFTDKDLSNDAPHHLRPEDAFWTRMRLIQIRNFLIRCQLLQITVRSMEGKPWKKYSDAQIDHYYKKIRYLAIKARNIAEAIGGDDLRARAEYWAGRGCGGLQDWLGATSHFAAAMKFDVPNYMDEDGKLLQRGLLQDEKEDVEFLLQSVKQHERDFQLRIRKALKKRYGEGHAKVYPPDIDWALIKGPRWTPDSDRVLEIARQQYGNTGQSMTRFLSTQEGVPAYTAEEIKFIYKRISLDDDDKNFPRKLLSEDEWRYIIRGDEQRYEEKTKPEAKKDARAPTPTSRSSSESSKEQTSRKSSLDSNEEDVGEHPPVFTPSISSPLPPLLSKIESREPPSPRPSIKERRQRKVRSIVMPGGRAARLASRAERRSGGSAETGEEEGEGEMVDVRLYYTPSVGDSASGVLRGGGEDEGGERTPRVAGAEG